LYGYIGVISDTNQNNDYRENLSKNIAYELQSEDFEGCSKGGLKGVFTRHRKLTVNNLIFIIINFKSSIQRELDSFFKAINQSDFRIREVTKGAFTQARAKLNPEVFERLNQVAVDTFYQQAECYLWYDKRVISIDGTRLMLPNHPSITKEFGQHGFGPKANSTRSLAISSILYDVLNQIVVDGKLAPYNSSERELLIGHLDKLGPRDLLLLDRGYSGKWVLFLLLAKGIDFCVRMNKDWWLDALDFNTSSDIERIVKFKLPKKDAHYLDAYPDMIDQEITCRLVKVVLTNGENEILCTSLLDDEKYKYEEFGFLYGYRWNEEEAFKLLKSRIEVENFSGKTAVAVKQDYHAKLFLMTLCAAYAHPIEEKVREEYKADETRKFDQKINRTNALSMTQDIMIAVFLKKQIKAALAAFDKILSKTREIIRPGRIEPRNVKPKRPYSMNYKPL
jgi:hypothetical protein